MSTSPNPYKITLTALERKVHVPLEKQMATKNVDRPVERDADWVQQQRRNTFLAGGGSL